MNGEACSIICELPWMSEFLSRIKARLEPGQHTTAATWDDTGWVRAALASVEKEREVRVDRPDQTDQPVQGLVEKISNMTLATPDASTMSASSSIFLSPKLLSPQSASQEFWETGSLKSVIPDGFYSVAPSESLKVEIANDLPSIEELKKFGVEAAASDVLLVDTKKDAVLASLKELVSELVKDLGANVSLKIKKIAEVVADFYGGPVFEGGSVKTHPEENLEVVSVKNFSFLGEIKKGYCRPRALLFKVLADHVGLPTRLVMGLQLESVPSSSLICAIPNKHLSNILTLNGVEFIIDLLRHPGHLRPFSRKVLVMYHISGAGDSDSADYDSCDSPLEPNSPLFGFSERQDSESPEHDMDSQLQCLRREQFSPVAGPMMIMYPVLRPPSGFEAKLSPSQSEPDLTHPSRRRHRRKAGLEDQPTLHSPEHPYEILQSHGKLNTEGARSFPSSPEHPQARFRSVKRVGSEEGSVSSPEHPVFRVRAPSILSGSRRGPGEESDLVTASSPDQSPQHATMGEKPTGIFRRRRERSLSVDIKHEGRGIDFLQFITEPSSTRDTTALGGAWFGENFRGSHGSPSDVRRMKKRSAAPEVSDDVVRVVRAMNEAIKQGQRRMKEQQSYADVSSTSSTQANGGSNCEQVCENDSLLRDVHGAAADSSEPLEETSTVVDRGQDSSAKASSSRLDCISNSKAASLLAQPLMPYPEWNIDFSELQIGVRVGIGSFGEVFRGVWRGTEVAIKVMLEQHLTVENTEDFCNEISLLSRLRHPNVILFLGACMEPSHLSMVTEYMHMGSLYRLIHSSGQGKKLSWRRRLKMLRDICRGMMCVHGMNIVHRDLKSANCLVDKHWTVKICDFGLSRLAKDGPVRGTTAVGTPEWMAPELLRNEPVTEKCDIFSLGVIMWELCTLKKPWEGVKPMQVVYEVARNKARLEIPEGYLGKLISDCWEEDPSARPSYDEILSRLHECEFFLS